MSNPFSDLVNEEAVKEKLQINDLVEKVFNFTLDQNAKTSLKYHLVYLDEVAEATKQDWIDWDNVGNCLFERLLLPEPLSCVLPKNVSHPNDFTVRKEVVAYLFEAFNNIQHYGGVKVDWKNRIVGVIFENFITVLKQPILFEGQDVHEQFTVLLLGHENYIDFMTYLADSFVVDADGITLTDLFKPVLAKLQLRIKQSTLVTLNPKIIELLQFICSNDIWASVFMSCNFKDFKIGSDFGTTLIGELFSKSILPPTNNNRYEYFDRPFEDINSRLEGDLWLSSENLVINLHKMFLTLLKKKSSVKNQLLSWLCQCLQLNSDRGKLWNAHAPYQLNPTNFTNVSDSFIMTMGQVLLKLCMPFCTHPNKILKVDPTYCAVEDSAASKCGVNLLKMSEETCFVPAEDSKRPTASSYNFVTECFYVTHRCLDLGFRVCSERLVQSNQEMGRLQRIFNDAVMQAGGFSEELETMKTQMTSSMQRFLCLKSTLSQPKFLADLMQFQSATAIWLCQVAVNKTTSLELQPITFPLSEPVPETLKCIPEFICENIVNSLKFFRRFAPQVLEEHGFDVLSPLLTMILIYMGSPKYMRNPHMRAGLAECLEAMIPNAKYESESLRINIGSRERERIFNEHPHRGEIVRNLLNVFVSIEMTGQSVQFEQKFNYRRPMYLVMDYLWKLEEHRRSFLLLAKEAEENMEAVTPPIYLQFVNLLMNDAVFLLDEALSSMSEIRTLEAAKSNGEWDNLPPPERERQAAHLQQLTMIARYDNILGRDTTHSLRLLTENATAVFTHSTMVDRVAAMLNYFLMHLVGPKKKNLKVKDFKEYEFNPAKTVLDICHIYVALGNSDAFCLAILQDGRSYNPQLFTLAEDVLAKIGGGQLISDLREVAAKVESLCRQQQAEDELFTDAPDEFLDPIMSTLMLDPVLLPSSKQTVDRTTIARHLLSDQSDPFNRSPLTMDQVVPNAELADKIRAWIDAKKAQKSGEPIQPSEN